MNGYEAYGGYYPPVGMPPRENPIKKEKRRLFLTAVLIGIGPLLYIVNSSILTWIVRSSDMLYDKYLYDEVFGYAFDGLYSAYCVLLPFLLVYFLMRKLKLTDDIPLDTIHEPLNAVLLMIVGVGCCFVGNIITSYTSIILESFGIEFYSSSYLAETMTVTPSMLLLSILRGCVAPALFEEFAFRGVVLQSLRRYGDWFAILISALLFGFLHGNMIQMPFAFLIGIVLGYCAVVTGSLWVGICIHFLNNFCSTMYTAVLSSYATHPEYAVTMWSFMTYLFIIWGGLAMIAYVCRNRRFFRLYPAQVPFIRHRLLFTIISPTMLVSVGYLGELMLMDIKGFAGFFASLVT